MYCVYVLCIRIVYMYYVYMYSVYIFCIYVLCIYIMYCVYMYCIICIVFQVVPIGGDVYHSWLNDHVFDMRTAESFMSRYKRRLLDHHNSDALSDTQFKHCFEVLN